MNPLYATALFKAAPPPIGWPPVFSILTACNPLGQTMSAAENQEHDARLRLWIQKRRYWHWRVIGGSADFRHAEQGFAIVLPLLKVLAAGREFHQEAIFHVENDDLSILACRGDARQKLGSWRARIVHGTGSMNI